MTKEATDLPDVFRADLTQLDAEIVALEALQEGLDATIKQLVADELHHRIQKDHLNIIEPEPKTLDFLYGGDWHAAHAEWERRAVERKDKLAEVTEARERAWQTFLEFAQWVVRPAKERLDQLRAKRAQIVERRTGLCNAALRAAGIGGMVREPTH